MMYPLDPAAIRAERIETKNEDYLRNRMFAEQMYAEKLKTFPANFFGSLLEHLGTFLYTAGNKIRTGRGLNVYG